MKEKVLTVRQPFATLLCTGLKKEEYRNRKISYRGRILIHSSKVFDENSFFDDSYQQDLVEALEKVGTQEKFEEVISRTSAIIGSVEIVGCHKTGDGYAWEIANPVLFDKPVLKVPGKLGLWDYDSDYADNGGIAPLQIPKEQHQIRKKENIDELKEKPALSVSSKDIEMQIAALYSLEIEPPAQLLEKYQKIKELEAAGGRVSIFEKLRNNQQYVSELEECIRQAADKLLKFETDDLEKPGLLLGKIQSGKTRAFIGIIGLCFDKGIDHCIVFTKGTNALAKQTVVRLKHDFAYFTDNHNYQSGECTRINIFDIMDLSGNLTDYQINTEYNIIVCKKEFRNILRLEKLFDNNKSLKNKHILIIDDEADFASFGFGKKNGLITQRKIANQISLFREELEWYRYLQVTATPYSLYLQPNNDNIQTHEGYWSPIRPAFTVLVPEFKDYIGGKQYFEDSQDSESMYSSLFVRVTDNELEVLGSSNSRMLKRSVLESPSLTVFRRAFLGYLVGSAIRIINERKRNRLYRTSYLFHTEISKANHHWQFDIVGNFLNELKSLKEGELSSLLQPLYDDFQKSMTLALNRKEINDPMPSMQEVIEEVNRALGQGDIKINLVNSEKDVESLLNEKGQLRLTSGYNMFIGGFVLDRGITIDNLIAFFYGRNPHKFQQDTVLQHARMYGHRSLEDMAVTRFYTTQRIYNAMRRMYEFDNDLRETFEECVKYPERSDAAAFICYDPEQGIKPCSPQKILITETETLSPYKRFLPIGFQTGPKKEIEQSIYFIDMLLTHNPKYSTTNIFPLSCAHAAVIIQRIATTFIYDRPIDKNQSLEWDWKNFLGIIYRLAQKSEYINCMVRTNRNIVRVRDNGSFSDIPYNGVVELPMARAASSTLPTLMLFRENGATAQGWRGTPFYWPVLLCPKNTIKSIFACRQLDLGVEEDDDEIENKT